MKRWKTTRLVSCAAVCAALMTAGCTQAPGINILGSLFPAWLLCVVLGILLAVLARWLLQRARIAILFPVLVYPCLAAGFTFAIWLVFFQ
jgi:hypothetical protein